MQAFGFIKSGGPEVFQSLTVKDPVPRANEVLIDITAIGLNNRERAIRQRETRGVTITGFDIAGRIEALGEGVTDYTIGERVVAHTEHGYAEKATANVDNIAPIPDNVTDEQAVAIITTGITAYRIVDEFAAVAKGQTVIIKGASGGVGHLALQMAVRLGATVIGIASAKNRDQVLKAGASRVVAYDEENIAEVLADTGDIVINVALDGIGGSDDVAMVKPNGTIVSVAYDEPDATGKPFKFIHVNPSGKTNDGFILSDLMLLLADETLDFVVDSRLPLTLEGLIEGHRILDRPHHGRVILAK